MVSGFDIIFFWIARMIMMTMHFIKDENGKPQVPFHTVYMTGLIRDDEGQKMSKSKGNVIDPLDMVDGISLPELLEKRTGNMMQPQLADKIRKRTEKQFPNGIEPHGTDALRFTTAALASTGRDINWDMKRTEGYRNFCNKLWNASRFVLMNTEGQDCGFNGGEMTLSLADRWILAEFNQTIKAYREALDSFRFDIAAGILYEFTEPVLRLVSGADQAGNERWNRRRTARYSPYAGDCTGRSAAPRASDHSVHHRNHLAACESTLRYHCRHHHAAAVPAV